MIKTVRKSFTQITKSNKCNCFPVSTQGQSESKCFFLGWDTGMNFTHRGSKKGQTLLTLRQILN